MARQVPGTAGHRILAWPWIGTPGATSNRVGEIAYRRLRNLETSDVRDAEVPKAQVTWNCGITWCLGSGPSDGTMPRGIPGVRQPRTGPALDRYTIWEAKGSIKVVDLAAIR